MDKILIIGYGKLGSHLYYELKHSGKYKIVSVIKKRIITRNEYNKLVNEANVIFICVQDSKVPAAVKELSKIAISLKNKYIFHTSGALTSDILSPLKNNGAFIASFHPVQTFERKAIKYSGRFVDIYTAIEGDKPAIRKATVISKHINSNPFIIKKQNKVYHHICCVMASNFLAVLNSKIEETGSKKIQINGFKKHTILSIYMPLALQTLKNISSSGAKKSLTGPIERNDIETIENHLDALKSSDKEFLMFYVLMGIETVKLALDKKSIKKSDAIKIYRLFTKHIKLQ